MNIKKIIIGVSFICLLWIANLLYFQFQQLDEPMFLEHYYELSAYDDIDIPIYYLVNNNEDIEISFIQIPQLGDIDIYVENYKQNKYKYHTLKTSFIKLKGEEYKNAIAKEGFKITDLIVSFSNGDTKIVNIGQIFIYKNKPCLKGDNPFKFVSCGSSNNNKGYRTLSLRTPVTVADFEYILDKKLDGFLRVYIDANNDDLSKVIKQSKELENMEVEQKSRSNEIVVEKNIKEEMDLQREVINMMFNVDGVEVNNIDFPLKLDKNDYLKINYEFMSEDDDDIRYYNYYKVYARIMAEKDNGDKVIRDCKMHYTPHFSDSDIKRLVKERRKK